MITTFNLAEHVLAISVAEEVDESGMKNIENMAIDLLEKFESINVFLEVENGISFVALLKDLKFHIKYRQQLKKIAVVTEKELLQKIMEIKDMFLDTEIKVFSREDRIEAIAWVI